MNSVKNTNERGNFLNEDQKKIKEKIMMDLIDALLGNIEQNRKLFPDIQSFCDLALSVLIMFNREILTHFITSFNLEGIRKQLMKDLFGQIKDEVNKNIKKRMI